MKAKTESISFDNFMQQSQVAQSGNPYWFGFKPRPNRPSVKAKSFQEFIGADRVPHENGSLS